MSQVTNAADIGFSSAFAVDKIVGIYTGNYNAAIQTPIGGYLYQFAIPHSFTRPVFCELLWSVDGINYVDGGSTDPAIGTSTIAYSDSSFIYITTSTSIGTVYYKVIAAWIDMYDGTNPSITPVLNTTNGVYFDSRQNYQKTYITGEVTASTLLIDNLFSIPHNLGYTPNAKIYFESIAGQVWPQIYGGTQDFWLYDFAHQSECYAVITDTDLNIDCLLPASGHSTRIWYRIFLDQ